MSRKVIAILNKLSPAIYLSVESIILVPSSLSLREEISFDLQRRHGRDQADRVKLATNYSLLYPSTMVSRFRVAASRANRPRSMPESLIRIVEGGSRFFFSQLLPLMTRGI